MISVAAYFGFMMDSCVDKVEFNSKKAEMDKNQNKLVKFEY